MSNDTRPEIRFPGFTEDWEQRKLGDITESFSGGTPTAGKSEYYGGDIPFIRSGEISSELTELFITENGLNNSSAKMVEAGDILYALYGATSGEVSISRINGAINQAILAIRPTKNDNSYLIVQWLRKQKDTIISTYLQGGQGNLSGSIVKDLVITLPQDKEEQNKIGAFFKQLDDTIALHQRKLDLLKETKKGFLQKMFPKNGAKVPEVRFPGFTEDWEERKFGEIVQVSRGLTYKPSDVQIEGIRVLRSSNINEDVFVLRDDDVFVKPDAVNIAPIKNGDILITSANGSSRLVGKHAIVNGLQDKTVHGGFMLRVKSKNTWFTNSLMSSRWYNYFINIYVSGGNGAIGNLRKYDLESQTIIVPDDEEQQKIGAFFKQLDDTIALHQRKLDLLKETKKGFLQKMFV
ncbi:restriction endonuclease subunit S [Enterococcus faecium]|nr:restriction endonuclease subunit S [Enterococcus faecium]